MQIYIQSNLRFYITSLSPTISNSFAIYTLLYAVPSFATHNVNVKLVLHTITSTTATSTTHSQIAVRSCEIPSAYITAPLIIPPSLLSSLAGVKVPIFFSPQDSRTGPLRFLLIHKVHCNKGTSHPLFRGLLTSVQSRCLPDTSKNVPAGITFIADPLHKFSTSSLNI